MMQPGVKVDRAGEDRSHTNPHMLGAESPYGILYAPKEVNQDTQKAVERSIRSVADTYDGPGYQVQVGTMTRAHEGTNDLKSIE